MNIKGLEEKRNDLQSQISSLLENAKAEERAMNEEEVSKFDEMEKEIKNIDATIEREERVNNMEEKEIKVEEKLTQEERDVKAFAGFIRNEVSGFASRSDDATQLTKGDNGAVIPSTIINKIMERVEEVSPVYRLATKYRLAGTVTIPKEDRSTDHVTVAYATEFSDLTSHANKFSNISLTGYLYGALTKVSKSLLNNSDFNLTQWVINKMAKEIAKFIEGELLNGTENKVSGIAGSYDSTNMKVTLANNNTVTCDELIDLQEKLPDVYQGDAIWIMNKATRTAIRKLKDNDNNYLLNRDFSAKWGYTLLGKDVYCSDNVNALGSNSKNVIFYGDLSGLAVKESETAEISILKELYAAQHAIGVVAYGEIDAKVEDTQKIAVAVTPSGSGV